jgi:hypothetical protein
VNGGDIQVTESVEGLEGAHITLNDGAVAIVASDDGVNGAGETAVTDATTDPAQGVVPGPGGPMGGGSFTLAIHGGTLVVEAARDGIDVNGTIDMTGGLVIVNGPTKRMNGAVTQIGAVAASARRRRPESSLERQ